MQIAFKLKRLQLISLIKVLKVCRIILKVNSNNNFKFLKSKLRPNRNPNKTNKKLRLKPKKLIHTKSRQLLQCLMTLKI